MDLEEWEFLSDDGLLAIQHESGSTNKRVRDFDDLGVPEPITEVQKSVDFAPIKQAFSKENEFADMKMDSPKSWDSGINPQIEVGLIQFGETEVHKGRDSEIKASKMVIEQPIEKDHANSELKEKGGLRIWRRRLAGIGGLCSIGVAAATVFLLIFGARKRQKQLVYQKPQFQIYAEDKSIKQVVNHATKLNQAISVVRGAPLGRAHITFGGHYDGLG